MEIFGIPLWAYPVIVLYNLYLFYHLYPSRVRRVLSVLSPETKGWVSFDGELVQLPSGWSFQGFTSEGERWITGALSADQIAARTDLYAKNEREGAKGLLQIIAPSYDEAEYFVSARGVRGHEIKRQEDGTYFARREF